jgi:hypothetical protein
MIRFLNAPETGLGFRNLSIVKLLIQQSSLVSLSHWHLHLFQKVDSRLYQDVRQSPQRIMNAIHSNFSY